MKTQELRVIVFAKSTKKIYKKSSKWQKFIMRLFIEFCVCMSKNRKILTSNQISFFSFLYGGGFAQHNLAMYTSVRIAPLVNAIFPSFKKSVMLCSKKYMHSNIKNDYIDYLTGVLPPYFLNKENNYSFYNYPIRCNHSVLKTKS